jgi:hypothetical protein
MRVAEPKRDKAEVFGEASRAAAGLAESSGGPATQPRKKKASEPAEPTADSPGSAPEQPAVATPAAE